MNGFFWGLLVAAVFAFAFWVDTILRNRTDDDE